MVLGWLARSFGTQILAKDLERFRSDSQAQLAGTSEKLKHELALATLEHQIRFSRLHERRAEVVANLYELLVEAEWAASSLVSPTQWSDEPSKREKYVSAMRKAAEFYKQFEKSRIYLPDSLCSQLESYHNDLRHEVIDFGIYTTIDVDVMTNATAEKMHDAWIRAAKYFETAAPVARKALEAELRAMLGDLRN